MRPDHTHAIDKPYRVLQSRHEHKQADKAISNRGDEKGSTESLLPQMQTRAELYNRISYPDFENLDQSITKSINS